MDAELARAEEWNVRRTRRAAWRRRMFAAMHGDRPARQLLEDDWAPVIRPDQRNRGVNDA